MPIGLLPSLLLQLFAVGYTPGPANLFAMSSSMRYGKTVALKMWWGLLVGFLIAATGAAVATHFLGLILGDYVKYLKYLGAAYIVYLAIRMICLSGNNAEDKRGCTFTNGFLVAVTNAKMILFDLSIFSSFVLPYSSRFVDLMVAVALLLIAGPCANLLWLLAGSALSHWIGRFRKAVDIVMAILLIGCAVMIVLS